MTSPSQFTALPVNVICGFLGVGKTTAIRSLLKQKPADEHWAVLINEMGEVGIDGDLVAADGIAVKQIAGGCMCCVSDLPSKVTLNALIREQKPDRILVEPSGIASPKTILETYRSDQYREVLDVQATVCLIDPWMISQPQFADLPTFQEQCQLADVLLASKGDAASAEDLQTFHQWASQFPDKTHVGVITQGNIDPIWLSGVAKAGAVAEHSDSSHHHHHHSHDHTPAPSEQPVVDEDGITRHPNRSPEAWACGWLIPEPYRFQQQDIMQWLSELNIPRIKGLLHTEQGWIAFNRMRQHCHVETVEPPASSESALEMISMEEVDWSDVHQQLKSRLIG